MATDAFAYGIRAVISHVADGSERSIAFTSRTLNSSEINYSQFPNEASAIIFGLKNFPQYLHGSKFILETDHQPEVTIFGPRTSVLTLVAARLRHWAIIVSAYQYEIKYRNSNRHLNAGSLSRSPLKGVSPALGEESEVLQLSYVKELPVTGKQVSEATILDPILSTVLEFTLTAWSNVIQDQSLNPFLIRRTELSSECVSCGAASGDSSKISL